jgi:Domain of unknown function (DUF1963)
MHASRPVLHRGLACIGSEDTELGVLTELKVGHVSGSMQAVAMPRHLKGREFMEGERSAVLVRRSDLPVPLKHPARSYFGGLPKLPPGFDWPRAEGVEEDPVALTFIAQIDLTEVPNVERRRLLPKTGTLYFFCSSVFEGEGAPPCRVLYHAAKTDALPERAPPPDLMPLAGNGGDYQVKWLDPRSDFHSKVEFKYPISFLPFRDIPAQHGPAEGELRIEALCEVLGRGEPDEPDLLLNRDVGNYAKDVNWPFNWLLITNVARSVLCHVRYDLEPSPYREPLNGETRGTLQNLDALANGWLERAKRKPALENVDAEAKKAFRAWWIDVALTFEKMRGQVWTYDLEIREDLRNAINHTIRFMAATGEQALVRAPLIYVENIKRRNHWTIPSGDDGQSGFFRTAIHQMLGHGSSWQDAPLEHCDDVLLLQVQGDDAFFNWHTNCGCVLHFWIGHDALSKLDFSEVEATLECD